MKIKHLIIVFALLGSSCGARKRAMDLQKAEIKTLNDIVLSIQKDINSNVRLTKQSNILKLSPIDPTKESSYTDSKGNTHVFKNSQIILDSSKTDSVADLTDKSKTDLTDKSSKEVKTKDKSTDTDYQGFDWKGVNWALAFLVLIVAGVLAFRYLPKKKT